MNCERVRNLISAYLDRELPSEEARLIRAHLVTCAACNRELEAEAAVKESLGRLGSHEPPADLLPSVLAQLSGVQLDRRRRPSVGALRWAAVGAAAAVLLALPAIRQYRSAEYVVEAEALYRRHSLVRAGRPLADRALSDYYYALAGAEGHTLGGVGAAERVKLVGQVVGD